MIIIGYQGIGKSTVSSIETGCIDLESSNFWINGKRHDDWYVPYCNIALQLSKQGYTVFVSSHKEVRDYLLPFATSGTSEFIVCMYPGEILKDEWIERLRSRYVKTPSKKNQKALMNAVDRFEENIDELRNWGGFTWCIDSMKYSLIDIINSLR